MARPGGIARLTGLLAVALTASLSGCGSTSSSPPGTSRTSPAVDVAGAKAEIARFMRLPAFVAPGMAFDARAKLAGATIYEIPITSEVPFVSEVERGMRQATQLVGAKLVVYPNQGQPSQWAQGIETAIARHAAAITLFAQDPALLGPQIDRAEKAGIPVVVLRTTGEGERCEADPNRKTYGTTCVPGPFEEAGRLEADWVIAARQDRGDTLVITSDDARSTKPLTTALREEFRRRCPTCRLSFVDVPIPAWAEKIPSAVQSALVRDPKIDYVIPIYDSMSQFVIAAVRAARAGHRVRIAAFNGTPFVLKLMQDGDVVAMDAGENLAWLGWAAMDQTFRVVAGKPPVRSEHTALRVFDAADVNEAGRPPMFDQGYGRSYVSGYRKLWGVD